MNQYFFQIKKKKRKQKTCRENSKKTLKNNKNFSIVERLKNYQKIHSNFLDINQII